MSIEMLAELNPEALTPDGLEAAYIGFTMNHHHAHVAVYSYEKCVGILVDRDGMTPDDAEEFLSFNTLGSFVGENGPLFVSAGVPEMDSGADRKSVATQGSAHSCGQPFDSAPATQVCPHVRGTVTQHCSLNFTLTDEEQEAIELLVEYSSLRAKDEMVFRSLLKRARDQSK